MKNKFGWGSLLAVIGFLSLAAGTASAGVLTFNFTSAGAITDADSCGLGCFEIHTEGTAVETGGLPGSNSWNFAGSMKFYQGSGIGVGIGSGAGLGWSFTDTTGGNDLYGSFFTTLFGNVGDLIRYGNVGYSIEGGNGLFSGAQGVGTSSLTLLLGVLFLEAGTMNVVTSVPEPGTTGLLAAGLAMIGFMAYRRRRSLPLR